MKNKRYSRFLIGCYVAMNKLETEDWSSVIKAYRVLEKMRAKLPDIQQELEPPLIYANAMYFFAKAECCDYFLDFENSVRQMQCAIELCIVAKQLYPRDASEALMLIHHLHKRCGARMRDYISHIGNRHERREMLKKCPICGKPHPDKTGMHLVPLLLIKHLFPRFKEVAVEENHAMAYSFGYVGRNLGNYINDIRGYELTEEEIELEQLMPNPLTRDYLWCSDCEKRFSAIENEMLKVHDLQLKKKDYEWKVPYLFWLSVFFRMSIGKMSIHLEQSVEEDIAKMIHLGVEPNGTFHWENVRTCYYYGASQCQDLREEPMGIFGTREQKIPYVVIIGNLVMTFFPSEQAKEEFRKIDPYMHFNNGTSPEIWDNLLFKNFWDRHLFVSYENAEYDTMHLGQSDISDVILPDSRMIDLLKDKHVISIGDYNFMKGKYPLIIPIALREIFPRKMQDPQLSLEDLAQGTLYSSEEVGFMLAQLRYRLERLTNHLQKYYEEHPVSMEEQDYTPEIYRYPLGHTYIQIRPGKMPKFHNGITEIPAAPPPF